MLLDIYRLYDYNVFEVINVSRKQWSKEETEELISLAKIMTPTELSIKYEVTRQAIADKLRKQGVSSKMLLGVNWTQKEDQLLQQHFADASKAYLMDLFPSRTWSSIWQRGRKTLGIHRRTQDRVYVNHTCFDTWNEYTAYILGFILADGYIIHNSKYSNSLQIELHQKDIDNLEKIATYMDYRGKLLKKESRNPHVTLQCNNVHIIEQLIDKGIPLKDKSYVAKFPDKVPEQYLKDVCRGIIDGDGWSTFNGKQYILGLCGSYHVVSTVKNLFPYDCSHNSIRQGSEHCWNFTITGYKAWNIADWLYGDATIFLDRKYNAYISAKQKYAPSSEQSGEDTQ